MRRHPQRPRTNQDRWLVSYADFITLMFGFFVVLFAFARADRQRQTAIVASIHSAFSHVEKPASAARVDMSAEPAPFVSTPPAAAQQASILNADVLSLARVREDLVQTQRDLNQNLSGQLASHAISMYMGRDGLVISLREAGFFPSGSATPSASTLPILRQVAASLARTSFDLRIEGHTDNVPMHSAEFDSNWELSTARATCIARMVLNLSGVSPDRISAAGYAGFHPIASNETPEGRSQNRRVDLVLVPRTRIDFSAADHANWRRVADD